ncbi:MAG: SMP-30/gluconolactonase/LRE family protein [Acidobacteria bacterium]|nr:SMP-30/gluconolactonase/LRE family protein [Acidobacteriota bacterium]
MHVFEAQPLFTPPPGALRFLPECPRVLRAEPGKLGWVAIQYGADSKEGSFNILDIATGENSVHPLPGRPGFFAETVEPGVIVVGLERDLAMYDYRNRRLLGARVRVTDDERVVINDGVAVEGGLLFGTKHLTFQERIACMYLYDGELHTLHSSQICANGKFLNAGRLVDIDSFNKTLDEYPYSGRTLGQRRIIADFRDTPLYPDGLRPSPDGASVIVAFFNPEPAPCGLARQFRIADGEVLAEWRLPGSPRVTCPEFLLHEGRVKILFTTAVEGMEPAVPLAGSMFIAGTPFDTLPAPPPLFNGLR